MDELIWDDGKVVRGTPPLAGEVAWGAFTTVGCDRGRPMLWVQHEERLHRTLERLLPGSSFRLPTELELVELLEAGRLAGPARLRVVANLLPEGTSWRVRAHAVPVTLCGPGLPPSRLMVVRWPGIPPLADLKTVSRLPWDLARRHAKEGGADEALLVTRDGQVLEAAVANVFAVFGNRLVTPPADGRCLPGVMRAWLLSAAKDLGLKPLEKPLRLEELLEADEVWTTGSTSGVRRVGAIGPRRFVTWPVWSLLAPLGVPAPGWPVNEP